MLISLLLKLGNKITILADTSSVQKSDYHLAADQYQNRYRNGNSTTLVNVEENGAIFNLIRRIKQGAVTIAFLDGNKGVDGQPKENENLLDIPFFNGIVKVRKGLAYMSYITKTPIALALSYHENNKDYLRFYEPLWSDAKDREVYCSEIITKIFGHFAGHTKNYLDQWSNLPYFHRWSDLSVFRKPLLSGTFVSADMGQKTWRFNNHRFCPILVEGENYLFDRFNYSVLPVRTDLVNLFSRKTSPDQKSALFENCCRTNQDIAREFLSREVFTEA
jgi:hypothetical protein